MRQGVVGACVTAQRSAGGPSAEQGSEGTAPRRRADTSAAAVHRESLPSVPLKAPPRPPTWRQLRRRVCRLHGGGHKGDPLVLGRHVVRVGAAKHVDVCTAQHNVAEEAESGRRRRGHSHPSQPSRAAERNPKIPSSLSTAACRRWRAAASPHPATAGASPAPDSPNHDPRPPHQRPLAHTHRGGG